MLKEVNRLIKLDLLDAHNQSLVELRPKGSGNKVYKQLLPQPNSYLINQMKYPVDSGQHGCT